MSYCLCTLPPQRTPYTCLCLYAISTVPDCNSCSAPCTSYEPDCCESDEYLRVLYVLDTALGSCLPLVCCSPLHTELTALQTASTPTSCATALESTGATYDEHAIEQQTTLVFYLAQQAQQQDAPVYNHTSLVPYALHQSTLQWVCTSLTNDKTSLIRTMYITYQRVNTILKYNKIATDINKMDKNALQYTLNRWQGNRSWKEQALQHARASASADGTNDHVLRDTETQLDTLNTNIGRLQAVLQATEQHGANLQTVKQSYVEVQRILETVLQDTCKTFQDHWLSVGCNGNTNTQAVRTLVFNYSTVTMQLQRVRTLLENTNAFVQQASLDRGWSALGQIMSKTSPALDAHLVKLGRLHMSTESNRRMRECLSRFLSAFFCQDGAVTGTYLESAWCNPQMCQLKTHMSELRHCVALAEAVVHNI